MNCGRVSLPDLREATKSIELVQELIGAELIGIGNFEIRE